MSLIVSIIKKKDTNIDTNDLENQVPSPHNELFGFESCRKTLWGHDVMQLIGCEMIYSLKEFDIIVFDEDINILKCELLNILDNIDTIQSATGYDKEFIEFRVKNALEMIKIAINEIDKVGIALW
ncbi:hypothetical protein [Pseudobacteroides cellulosolvens]|uniref:Uncharacterized protein n=1 Tax=Pseudobacteroides cellulosolvens ATCC 35603 = DSM 2933 TaxID=398512 RepID=A0A0L6JJ72_9FIRM|nr:hypothetical protein [Pseudobacteroides cellulosolvens]KNY25926.1 hypothetical protein Bccel_1186 [Pseudobacteroides cellulosolvens ATCC 35603 = DSM 2933]